MIAVLYTRNYFSNHSIYSAQAIIVSTLVGHCLGHSNLNTTLITSAIRIAQCMGLDKQRIMSGEISWNCRVKREVVRRVWAQLCIQDGFAIAFASTYTIHPDHFCTPVPLNCDDETLEELSMEHQKVSSYCLALAKIARLMPEIINGVYNFRTPNPAENRYQHVIDMDFRMRKLVAGLPKFLLRSSSEPPRYPWVSWARIKLTISAADKIIMIHKPFMVRSFHTSLYSHTRVTCVSVAATTLHEYAGVKDMDVTAIWVVPAFAIAAAIILTLDMLHQPPTEPAVP